MRKRDLFTDYSGDEIEERQLSVSPPPLPSTVRYTDDFTDKSHAVSNTAENKWRLMYSGTAEYLYFDRYANDPNLVQVMKAFALDAIAKYSAATAVRYLSGLGHLSSAIIVEIIEANPKEIRNSWDLIRTRDHPMTTYVGIKALLRFSCERHLGAWTSLYLPYISASLPLPPQDKLAAIRTGDVFLSIEEEAALVRWIYEKALSPKELNDEDLIDAAITICNYQFAMRPKQIGILRARDCRVIQTEEAGVSVHLTFRMLKQRSDVHTRVPLIRKVKREWAPIFVELYSRRMDSGGDTHLFGHESASSVAVALTRILSEMLGKDRTATDLRHSGAMRMVDAGASAEDLAEFMGHSSLESGLVYFDHSATQAERVNDALGISDTYQRVALLGKNRYISSGELAELKSEQQIAGVPHGIPIAGIGGCQTGQPSCPYNPITACYGCPKFMPVNEIQIHSRVLTDLRSVVSFFYDSSRGEANSPAYLQLKRTISEVSAVVEDLGGANA